jgi:hypothetical protein
MKVTTKTLLAYYGGPHVNVCDVDCRHAGWSCPDEEDDEGEPTAGALPLPPTLTFTLPVPAQ